MNCTYYNCQREATTRNNLCRTHYKAEWRKANPEKHKAEQRRYYQKHSERHKITRDAWRERNKEHLRNYSKQYMAKNSQNPVTEEHMTDRVKERFFVKVYKTDSCWNWTGAKTAWRPKRLHADATKGYGVININGRVFYAHRASWLMHKGPLIPGLVIDHLCENTLCVNPQHLQQVTNHENTTRSPKSTANGARYLKSHCKNGHVRTDEMIGKSCFECYPRGGRKKICVKGHERKIEDKGKRCSECYKQDLANRREQTRLKKLDKQAY
jgi:hypothetical protein